MSAASYDMYIEQGATFRFTTIYGHKTGAVDTDGNPVIDPYDITGCKIRMQIRQRVGTEVLVAATTSNSGILIPTGTDGKFIVTITDEATDTLSIKKAVYDIEINYPSGDVVRVLQGNVTISPNVTRGADAADIATGVPTAFDTDEQGVDVDYEVADQQSTFPTD